MGESCLWRDCRHCFSFISTCWQKLRHAWKSGRLSQLLSVLMWHSGKLELKTEPRCETSMTSNTDTVLTFGRPHSVEQSVAR